MERRVKITILINNPLTILINDPIFQTVMMMIANWMVESVKPQVVITRLSTIFPASFPTQNVIKSAGAIRRVMPRSATGRSRTA